MEGFEEEENDNGASFRRYRAVDLIIWTFIAGVFEAIVTLAASSWFPNELYCLSVTIAVVSIVMMRWGGFAAIQAVVGGAVYSFLLAGSDVEKIVVYCVGNCFMMLGLVLLKIVGKEKLRANYMLTAVYALLMYLLAQMGRWIVSLFFGGEVGELFGFLLTDVVTLLFTIVVVLISRVPDGLFEDQKHYIIRTDNERRRSDGQDYL
ncbi:MAG: hypothetical protein J1F28_05315 [Oscillospiraceae bacterium]|nr:hypothetical protein [Oscillospiraceae bacterium]